MIKAILVDDEQDNILTLKECLADFKKNIEIIGTYTDPRKAIQDVKKKKPDVLFLDIEMPSINGLSLAKETAGCYGELIFVTGHKKYWQDAFNVHAFQFLLKPIRDDKLSLIIDELVVREKNGWLGQWQERIKELEKSKREDTLCFNYVWLTKSDTKILHKVFWDEIILFEIFEKNKNEVIIHTKKGGMYNRKNTTLAAIQENILKLDEKIKKNFYRINHHQILNYEYAKSFFPTQKIISVNELSINEKSLKIGDDYPHALAAIKKNILVNRDRMK